MSRVLNYLLNTPLYWSWFNIFFSVWLTNTIFHIITCLIVFVDNFGMMYSSFIHYSLPSFILLCFSPIGYALFCVLHLLWIFFQISSGQYFFIGAFIVPYSYIFIVLARDLWRVSHAFLLCRMCNFSLLVSISYVLADHCLVSSWSKMIVIRRCPTVCEIDSLKNLTFYSSCHVH